MLKDKNQFFHFSSTILFWGTHIENKKFFDAQ
jgi:hypothetical protein